MNNQFTDNFRFISLRGFEARDYFSSIAKLRLEIFKEYPYLYEGEIEYEKKYLETYFSAKSSLIYLVFKNDDLIGLTTCIHASEEEESFKRPFLDYQLNPEHVCYFGESLLKREWRGIGLGKKFFQVREEFAKSITGVRYLSFASVLRESHALKPIDYQNHHEFWKKMGFKEAKGLITSYSWRDIDQDVETKKNMQFWIKEI